MTVTLAVLIGIHALSLIMMTIVAFEYMHIDRKYGALMDAIGGPQRFADGKALLLAYVTITALVTIFSTVFLLLS